MTELVSKTPESMACDGGLLASRGIAGGTLPFWNEDFCEHILGKWEGNRTDWDAIFI